MGSINIGSESWVHVSIEEIGQTASEAKDSVRRLKWSAHSFACASLDIECEVRQGGACCSRGRIWDECKDTTAHLFEALTDSVHVVNKTLHRE